MVFCTVATQTPKTVAKIAIEVQQKQLFKDKYKSFTAWVNAIAEKCDRQPSLIWRYIKAGKYYLESIESEDIEQIELAEAAPEVLVNLEKVQRHAPEEVFIDLKDKVLAGEVTVSESREIEQQYRPERPSKVTPQVVTPTNTEVEEVKGGKDIESHVQEGLEKSSTTNTKSTPATRIADSIARTLSITLVDWSKNCAEMRYPPKFSQAHTEVRVNHERKRLRLDLVAVVRWSFKKPKDILAIEIKSSLSDFESDRKWENYLQFCDFFCFAIPRDDVDLWAAIEDQTNSEVGILGIDFETGLQQNEAYQYQQVEILRKPKRLAGNSKFLIYETLYERVLNWSGSDSDDDFGSNS